MVCAIIGMEIHLEKYAFCVPHIQNHKDLTHNKGPPKGLEGKLLNVFALD